MNLPLLRRLWPTFKRLALLLAFVAVPLRAPAAGVVPPALNQGAFQTQQYRNLFAEIGKSPEAVKAKIDTAWSAYFGRGGRDQTLYFALGDDEAYILNAQDKDVRSEGLSYGMMIAAQLDQPEVFDRLWRFAQRRMLHRGGDHVGYFCWKASPAGKCLDDGAAPDGEIYFAASLLFAHHRWGVQTYANDAQSLLRRMLHKKPSGLVQPMFNLKRNQVVFSPVGDGATFTDPSYHLPAFFHLFSLWGPLEDRVHWQAIRDTSRNFFSKAAHPKTCLSPEYATFEGLPQWGYNWKADRFDQPEQKQSRDDAFRVVFNWAIDYAWFAADPRQVELSTCLLAFYADPAGGGGFVASPGGEVRSNYWRYYNLDGSLNQAGLPNLDPAQGGSNHKAWAGQAGMHAAGVLAARSGNAWPLDFVRALWSIQPPSGQYRYYDGMLYLLGLLASSGQYRIYEPEPPLQGSTLLQNGGFDGQLQGWLVKEVGLRPGFAGVAAADPSAGPDPELARAAGVRVVDGVLAAAVSAAQAEPSALQLQQRLPLSPSQRYVLEFDARASAGPVPRPLTVALQSSDGQVAAKAEVRLGRTLQRVQMQITTRAGPESISQLAFWLGGPAGGVEIDNVVLVAQ